KVKNARFRKRALQNQIQKPQNVTTLWPGLAWRLGRRNLLLLGAGTSLCLLARGSFGRFRGNCGRWSRRRRRVWRGRLAALLAGGRRCAWHLACRSREARVQKFREPGDRSSRWGAA